MITVLQGQSWLDLAIIHCGDASLAYEIAKANSMSITDDIEPGAVKFIPDNLTGNRSTVSYYSSKGLKPATAVTGDFDIDRVFDRPFPLQFS
jgi:hypothetical protein